MHTTVMDTGTAYLTRVHIDTSKVLADGTPDPEWIAEWTWGKEEPPRTQDEQVAMCVREAELLAALDPRLQPPVKVELW